MVFAKLFGLTYLVIGLGILFSKDSYKKVYKDVSEVGVASYFGGALAFVFGLLVANYHNLWVGSWEVIITILGWAALIKGASLLLFPKQSIAMGKSMMKADGMYYFAGIFAAVIGAILTYYGYFA